MTTAWRAAGLTYIQFSNICAKVVREGLKAEHQAEALKRSVSLVKFNPWKDGKPIRRPKKE